MGFLPALFCWFHIEFLSKLVSVIATKGKQSHQSQGATTDRNLTSPPAPLLSKERGVEQGFMEYL